MHEYFHVVNGFWVNISWKEWSFVSFHTFSNIFFVCMLIFFIWLYDIYLIFRKMYIFLLHFIEMIIFLPIIFKFFYVNSRVCILYISFLLRFFKLLLSFLEILETYSCFFKYRYVWLCLMFLYYIHLIFGYCLVRILYF